MLPSGGGLLVAFATAPGSIALDGEGSNSPFAQALLTWLPQPNMEIEEVMKHVKADVMARTHNSQRPWTNSDLANDVFLTSGSSR